MIIELASEGMTDKEIAARLNISLSTVRTYWERIRTKLKVFNRAHAVAVGRAAKELESVPHDISTMILRNIHDEAIFCCGKDGKLLTWNQGVQNLFGWSEEEWVGEDGSIFFIESEKRDVDIELEAADRDGMSVFYRWHQRKDKSRFWGANIVIHLPVEVDHVAYAKIVRLSEPPPQER